MIRISIRRNGAVSCAADLDLPLAPISVWGQLRDFQRSARHDLFHADVWIDGSVARAGAGLRLSHRYAGLHVRRHGRILIWREGIGFSFSDLSLRGPRCGFPHVLSFRIQPAADSGSSLSIRTTGLWTARFVPRPLARLWLRWVFGHVVRQVRNDLLLYQIWRRGRSPATIITPVTDRQINSD